MSVAASTMGPPCVALGEEGATVARVRTTINQAGMLRMQRQIASRIQQADMRFREEWGGQPVEAITPHVRDAFARIGVENLPSAAIGDYAAAVSKAEPFEWRLS